MTGPVKQKLRTKKYNTRLRRLGISEHSKASRYLAVILIIGFGAIGYHTLKYSQAATGDFGIVSDNFERPTLGSNWTVNVGNVGIVNQSDIGLTAQSGAGITSWTGSTLTADQFSEATIASDIINNMLTQVFVRRRTTDSARYAFHYNKGPDVVTPRWEIKYDGVPTAQTRILVSSTVAQPSPGDILRLEVSGSNPVLLKGYQNGALILSTSDSAATAIVSGQPGVTFRLALETTTTYPSPVFESWSGGNLAAPAPTPAPSPTPSPISPPASAPPPPSQTGSQPPAVTPQSSEPVGSASQSEQPSNNQENDTTSPATTDNSSGHTVSTSGHPVVANLVTKSNNYIKIGVISGAIVASIIAAVIFIKRRNVGL